MFNAQVTMNGKVMRTYNFTLDKLLEQGPEVFGSAMTDYFRALQEELKNHEMAM